MFIICAARGEGQAIVINFITVQGEGGYVNPYCVLFATDAFFAHINCEIMSDVLLESYGSEVWAIFSLRIY